MYDHSKFEDPALCQSYLTISICRYIRVIDKMLKSTEVEECPAHLLESVCWLKMYLEERALT
jgi:hypothetical protein